MSRSAMDQLRVRAEALAARGIGVPFFDALGEVPGVEQPHSDDLDSHLPSPSGRGGR